MRRLLMTMWCLGLALGGWAQAIQADAAYRKAKEFMGSRGKQVIDRPMPLKDTSDTASPAFYVFNGEKGEGFVIVSGDSRTETILGYADSGAFDEQSMPDNMRSWLQGYANEIAALRDGRVKTTQKVSTHAAITPLLTSKWDQGTADEQGDAYNMLCPTIGGKHCMAGCVATAMAQVMRYVKWPTAKTTIIPSYQPNDDLGTLQQLAAVRFDWSNMLDRYTGSETTAQKKAVAQLMRYCGQSVLMNYGVKSSASNSDRVSAALRNYFDYDTNTRHVVRSDYSAEGWDKLIYNELKASRPVYYSGSSTGGGHAFVCDGYDGQGLYHINWGWDGSHDGYYRLSVLNPDGGGTGSSGTEDGYTMDQEAVVGIQKPVDFDDDMRILTLDDLSYNGSTIEAKFWNRTGMEGSFEYGFAYQDVSIGGKSYYLRRQTDSFSVFGVRTYSLDVNTMNLADGTYRFYPFSRLEGADWYRVQGDLVTYLEVVVKDGQVQSISKHPKVSLTVKNVTCTGNKIVNMPQEVKIKIQNKADEFNDIFYLFASKTDDKGEAVNMTCMVIEEGATEEASLYFTPTSTGTWKLWIDINDTGSNNIGPYTVEIVSAPAGNSNLALIDYSIDTANNGVDVHATVKNKASQGYYRPVACAIFTEESSTSIMLQKSGNLNLAAGQTVTLDYHFEGLVIGKQHYAMLAQYPKHDANSLTVFGSRMYFVPTVSGIDGVTVRPANNGTFDAPADIYTITGTLIRRNANTLEGLPRGVYIVNGKKRVVR